MPGARDQLTRFHHSKNPAADDVDAAAVKLLRTLGASMRALAIPQVAFGIEEQPRPKLTFTYAPHRISVEARDAAFWLTSHDGGTTVALKTLAYDPVTRVFHALDGAGVPLPGEGDAESMLMREILAQWQKDADTLALKNAPRDAGWGAR